MRILVHEFVSGGGLAGGPVPASLAREGSAMRDALVEDLAALGSHRIVTTADPRYPLRRVPPGVEVVALESTRPAALDPLLARTDAAWLIAPETGGRLERLAARAARKGVRLLGSSASAIRRAADKGSLPRRLARAGVAHPRTFLVASLAEARARARMLRYPLIVKPARGAGCAGVSLVRDAGELAHALAMARVVNGARPVVMQSFVSGTAASVALLSDGRRAVPLAVSAQSLRVSGALAYRGGATPLDHPRAERAAAAALRACRAFPGLKGYVGVDVVLTPWEAVVIELNPRLTTAYLGIRAALAENIAALALDACAGRLRPTPLARRRVRFTAAGQVTRA